MNQLWTTEEEALLRELCSDHALRWNDIVARFEANGTPRTYEAIRRKAKALGIVKAMNPEDLYLELRKGKPRRIVDADMAAIVKLIARGFSVEVWEEEGRSWARLTKEPGSSGDGPPEYQILADRFNAQELTLGFVSDAHFGSKYALMGVTEYLHQELEKRGAQIIYDCGDLHDGIDMYPGHVFELTHHGGDQLELSVKEYPQVDIPREIVGGNHDFSHIKKAGFDIMRMFGRLRPDVHFLGYFQAQVPLTDKADIGLMHGTKGVAYARSYGPQRLFEQWADDKEWDEDERRELKVRWEPWSKPAIVAFGHWHIRGIFEYLGSELLLVPCAQRQTPYLKQKGLHPSIGGWLVRLRLADNGRIAGGTYEFLSP